MAEEHAIWSDGVSFIRGPQNEIDKILGLQKQNQQLRDILEKFLNAHTIDEWNRLRLSATEMIDTCGK